MLALGQHKGVQGREILGMRLVPITWKPCKKHPEPLGAPEAWCPELSGLGICAFHIPWSSGSGQLADPVLAIPQNWGAAYVGQFSSLTCTLAKPTEEASDFSKAGCTSSQGRRQPPCPAPPAGQGKHPVSTEASFPRVVESVGTLGAESQSAKASPL